VIGWLKVKDAAKYAGVSERTFRDWLKFGLKHSKLPSGTILTKPAYIDKYIEHFDVDQSTDFDKWIDETVAAVTAIN
jgi:hypothetical protein